MREMKDSGVEWVGLIPKDWIKTRVQFIGRFINGYAFKPENWGDEGLPIIRIQDLTGNNDNPNYYAGKIDNKYRVVSGDILISWAATLAAFRWNKGDAWLNQHIFKAIPNKEIVNSNFFFWLMNLAMNNMNNGNKHGIMMQHVTADIFNKFPVCLPQIPEQKRIAAFLDAKCAEIDALSADIQSEIDTLEAYRRSVITEAVTKGLDKNAPTKESGIEWAPRIPESWNVKKAKYNFKNHKYIPGAKSAEYDRLALTLNGVIHRSKDDADGLQPKDFLTYQLLRKGELVFKLIDLQNISTSRVGLAHDIGLVSPAYIILHATGDVLPEFAEKYFLMLWHREIFNALGDNGVRSNLNSTDLLSIPICYPSVSEQKRIVDFLDSKCDGIDAIIAQKQEQLAVLADYKKSIIYEYVTGKKEVPVA